MWSVKTCEGEVTAYCTGDAGHADVDGWSRHAGCKLYWAAMELGISHIELAEGAPNVYFEACCLVSAGAGLKGW